VTNSGVVFLAIIAVATLVMACVQVVLFPAASSAIHVMMVVPTGYGSASGFPSERVPVTPFSVQLSPADGTVTSTSALQKPNWLLTWIPAGHPISGAIRSSTVTFCVHEDVRPAESVAVHVMIVIPIG
jgi:hypothetical protein